MHGQQNIKKKLKFVSFAIAKINSWNFSPKETTLYFVMIFALVWSLLDANTIRLNGSCLLTLQKLA